MGKTRSFSPAQSRKSFQQFATGENILRHHCACRGTLRSVREGASLTHTPDLGAIGRNRKTSGGLYRSLHTNPKSRARCNENTKMSSGRVYKPDSVNDSLESVSYREHWEIEDSEYLKLSPDSVFLVRCWLGRVSGRWSIAQAFAALSALNFAQRFFCPAAIFFLAVRLNLYFFFPASIALPASFSNATIA